MGAVHMTEAELVNNIADVMRRVRQGSEIVIEEDNRPVAVIEKALPPEFVDFSLLVAAPTSGDYI